MSNLLLFNHIIFSFFTIQIYGQVIYPKDYFSLPIKEKITLSGNFGEIRSNHFHSGLDIKTGNVEGKSIFSIGDGFVSRIKISPSGYGNALYIDHPNGYTSVYAHLSKFNNTISDFAKQLQYKLESFEIDTMLSPTTLIVKKGELIAYSGNSGGSQGPHLHFEIRDTKSEKPVNPLFFGINIPDNIAPGVIRIVVYPLDEIATINGKNKMHTITPVFSNNNYQINPKDSLNLAGNIGFGIECFDRDNNSYNKNGVYSVELLSGGSRVYYSEVETFSFDNSRYINTHIDYESKVKIRKTIQKCYLSKNNELSIYKGMKNNGVINFNDGKTHWMKFIVKDFTGNKTELMIKANSELTNQVAYKPREIEKGIFMDCLKNNDFGESEIVASIPAKSFYDDLYFNFSKYNSSKYNYSKVFNLHYDYVALNNYIDVKIKPINVPENLASKLVAVLISNNGNEEYVGGTYENEWVNFKTKSLGTYALTLDTIAPIIKPVFKNHTNKEILVYANTQIKFHIKDDLSGVAKYTAHINKKWTLLEYDKKRNLFTLELPSGLSKGKHELIITANDYKNNSSSWITTLNKP